MQVRLLALMMAIAAATLFAAPPSALACDSNGDQLVVTSNTAPSCFDADTGFLSNTESILHLSNDCEVAIRVTCDACYGEWQPGGGSATLYPGDRHRPTLPLGFHRIRWESEAASGVIELETAGACGCAMAGGGSQGLAATALVLLAFMGWRRAPRKSRPEAA